MYTLKTKIKPKGFSLVEVMIAVLVLAIGILAVSKLQTSLLRSGADANYRSVAASLANKKVDDLKRFAYLNVANPWTAALTSPTSISFNHIASNEGGLLGPGDITIGNHVYTLNWTTSNYEFSGEGNNATVATAADATMKAVHVTVTWDAPGDIINNIVSFDTFIHGYHPLLTSVVAGTDSLDGGDINLKTGAVDSESFEFDGDSSFGSELIAPDVSKKGNSTVTKTVFSIFNTSSRVLESSDEYRTVACLCKNGTNNASQIYNVTSWDSINKRRTDVLEHRTGNTVTKTTVDSGGGDTPAAECFTCCRDGYGDDGSGNPDYGATDKICRLKLVGGKLYMSNPWKALALNIIPESYFTEGATGNLTAVTSTEENNNRTLYVTYLTSLIRNTLLNYTTSANYNALTTVDFTFKNDASDYLVGTTSHLKFTSGNDRQLQARVIYMDFPAQGSYEGSTYTATNIPLDRIPFAEFNVANLTGWAPDEDDTSASDDYTTEHDAAIQGNNVKIPCLTHPLDGCVSNQELIDKSEGDYSRGLFYTDTGSTSSITIEAPYYAGNNGLVNRDINNEITAIPTVSTTLLP